MDAPDTREFEGFEDGFAGFPKNVPEDCVEYTLFILDPKLASQMELVPRLEAVRKEASKLTETLLKEYIWQRDAFNLELETAKGRAHLHGITSYGDSVEDEWLIVYILKELSNRFPELWVKVVDTDGEFLLIEAANALPRWLNPEIADNRVWIHRNTLRIIPLSAADASSTAQTKPVSRSLTLDESLEIITSTPDTLIHSLLIEEETFYRLRNYPSQIPASLHHALATIPRKLAYILHARPASIAPAVEAFYLRDPVAMKPLQTKSSSLVFPPDDLVTVSVRFTKVLYAQSKSQQFPAPIAWQEAWTMAQSTETSDQLVQFEMGMKVSAGFEMLVTDPKNVDNRVVREINILLDDLAMDSDGSLPTDEDIASWKDGTRQDDEKWLDINFEDFERELEGKNKSSRPKGTFGPEPPSGFGDAKTQADLKKMVERFEAFLNDEGAGLEGAELDDMDVDDDEDEESIEDSEDENKDVSFDEHEFAKMMREMMGMPSEVKDQGGDDSLPKGKTESQTSGIKELDSDDECGDEDEDEEIRKVMRRMEAELNERGALNLDPTPKKLAALKGKATAAKDMDKPQDDAASESDENVNIDFSLAKNLLESFKSQVGLAGPGGNLLGMMGMQLPRDEDDSKQSG